MAIRYLFACCLLWLASTTTELRAQLRADEDTHSLNLPEIGEVSLKIIAPDLLEFTRISADAEGRPRTPVFAASIGGQALSISAVGARRRVAYAPLATRDLRIATHFFIRLGHPIDPAGAGQEVEIHDMEHSAGIPQATAIFDPLRCSPAIHVNQEGYVPSFPKKAMVGYYLGDMGELDIKAPSGFSIIDARSGAAVYTGALVPRRDSGFRTRPTPYQRVFVADFSDFTTPGEYRVLVPGLGTSLPFLIDDGIAMGFARTYALGLYHQRCGAANELPYTRFVHAACHLAPAQVPVQSDPQFAFTWKTIAGYAASANRDNPRQIAPSLTSEESQLYPFVRVGPVDVSGGHHDAGDYSKYTINSAELVHYLMFAEDSVAGVASLDNLGIPESGDGIGDVL